MPDTYLTRTPSSETNRKTFTFSAWCKFTDNENMIFNIGSDANNRSFIMITSHTILIENRDSGTRNCQLQTNRLFRDRSGWYHIVLSVDTTQATSSNRVKLYVNGVQETSFSTETYPSQNQLWDYNKASAHYIGRNAWSTGNPYNGLITHIHFIDGTAYAASTFGSTDSATGIWKPITNPSVTYGTNGFFLDFADSSAMGNDVSGNNNDFTSNGTGMTQTIDTPSNVFATLNPLIKATSGTPTFGNGNTTYKSTATGWDSGLSTIMPSSGKWYFEVRPQDNDNTIIGLVDVERNPEFLAGTSTYGYLGYKGLSYQSNSGGTGVVYRDNSNAYTGLSDWSANDTCGVAIDLDNQEMFLHINGTYTNSGNPATRANPYDFSSVVNSGNSVAMGVSSRNNFITYVNFGNGYFQTTAVSSAGTNAGVGTFEYDVPSGYKALCTKNLNAEEYS